MAEKKYYWLKLKRDFFSSVRIKKLRSLAGGDTFTIIYLKMLLTSMGDEGIIYFENVEENLADEIALLIDENADNVSITINYLLKVGLAELSETGLILTEIKELTGSESESAERVRRHRMSIKTLQCNADVTECNTEIEIEKDKEIEKSKSKRFVPPTLEEVKAYCDERGNDVDPQKWFDHYQSNGWMVGRTKMKDFRACIRTWERNTFDQPKKKEVLPDYYGKQEEEKVNEAERARVQALLEKMRVKQ